MLYSIIVSYLGEDGTKPKFATKQFRALGEFVVKRPVSVLFVSLALLLVPISQISKLAVTPSSISALPANLESAEAIKIATSRAGDGIISPIQVLISLPVATDVNMARAKLAGEIASHKDVFTVVTDRKYDDATGKILRRTLSRIQPISSYANLLIRKMSLNKSI